VPSLWHHPDYLRLWIGQTISRLGSVVTRTAMPLVALLVLGAGPAELALIVVLDSAGRLLVGLIAGAWVDRLRRRPLLIADDLARAALLLWIPLAHALGVLRIEQLYVLAFLQAALTVLFDAAYPAYVPTLIGRDRLVEGNSKLAMSEGVAEIGGPGFAGALVQLVGAPLAMLVDAVSFLASALSLGLIRTPEPAPARAAARRIVDEVVEGLGTVRRSPVLRAIALQSVPDHFFGAFYAVLYSLYLLRELRLDPFLLGIVISAGGVGALVGSLFAAPLIARIGIGPAIITTFIAASAIGVLTPLAQGPVALATLMVFLPQLIGDGLKTIDGVAEISLVQGITPDHVLGRVNATLDVVAHGVAYPLGAVAAAFAAELIGVRGAIAVAWAGMSLSVLFLVLSPIPRIRTVAQHAPVAVTA
jgi:MFS family permease